MNIFILDEDIKTSAMYHTDRHCVKMILEHCQMLCTAALINPTIYNMLNIVDVPYKKTHITHPCTIWVSKNLNNFAWLVAYTHELHEEYKYRYGRDHLSYGKLKSSNIITNDLIAFGNSLPILDLAPVSVMPEECKTGSVIENYRNYYRKYKTHLFSWTKRNPPYWL